eukprot:gene11152-17145_t
MGGPGGGKKGGGKKGKKGGKGSKGEKGDKGDRGERNLPNGAKLDEDSDAHTLEPDTLMQVCDPATREKFEVRFGDTEPTAGRVAYIFNIGTKRDSYLCMLFQKGRCKSHSRCNQIHAKRELVQEYRDNFFKVHQEESKPNVCEPLVHQRALEVVAVDPTNHTSRVVIPLVNTEETDGRTRFFEILEETGTPPVFHICPSYLQGTTCAKGRSCANIHTDKAYITFITEPNKACCPFHGTEAHVDYKGKIFMVNKHDARCPVPLDRLLPSKGLKGLMTYPGSLTFACNRVCRLHQEKRCQWTRECSNIHLCREFYSIYGSSVNPAATSLPSLPGLQILPSGKLKRIKSGNAASNGLSQSDSHESTPQHRGGKSDRVYGSANGGGGGGGGAFVSTFGSHKTLSQHNSHHGSAHSGGTDGPVVVGMPLSAPGTTSQTYGIPLVTEEGIVPLSLLPEQAKQRYPGAAGAMGTPVAGGDKANARPPSNPAAAHQTAMPSANGHLPRGPPQGGGYQQHPQPPYHQQQQQQGPAQYQMPMGMQGAPQHPGMLYAYPPQHGQAPPPYSSVPAAMQVGAKPPQPDVPESLKHVDEVDSEPATTPPQTPVFTALQPTTSFRGGSAGGGGGGHGPPNNGKAFPSSHIAVPTPDQQSHQQQQLPLSSFAGGPPHGAAGHPSHKGDAHELVHTGSSTHMHSPPHHHHPPPPPAQGPHLQQHHSGYINGPRGGNNGPPGAGLPYTWSEYEKRDASGTDPQGLSYFFTQETLVADMIGRVGQQQLRGVQRWER